MRADRPLWYILNEEGEPVPCEGDLGRQWLDVMPRQVGRTVLQLKPKEIAVSTVFLCLDHQYLDGPPILWETLVFGGPLDGEQWRYSTRQEAEAGHIEMVGRVRHALEHPKAYAVTEDEDEETDPDDQPPPDDPRTPGPRPRALGPGTPDPGDR